MTRMRLVSGTSFTEAQELVEDIRKQRDTSPTGAVSFVNYYSVSQFFYQSTITQFYNTTTVVGVGSFNTRTGDVVPATNDYTWAQVDKTTSDVADLATKNVEDMTFSDNTTKNVSTTKHGLAPKVTDTGKFLRGDGVWFTPTAGGGGGIEVKIGEAALSGTRVSFTSIPAGYRRFKLIVASKELTYPVVLYFNADSSAGYRWERILADNTTLTAAQDTSEGNIQISDAYSAEAALNYVWIENVPGLVHMVLFENIRTTAGEAQYYKGGGYWGNSASEINEITVSVANGVWSLGTMYLYGWTS